MARSDPLVLWMIRAGDTQWQRERRLQGRADLPLSEEGRATVLAEIARYAGRPAAGNGRGAPVATVHHPPDEGAAETAAIVAKALHGRARPAPELAEPDLGVLDGLTLETFEDRFPTRFRQWQEEPESLVPPEGEDFASARRRILLELSRLVRRPRGPVAVVLHPVATGFARCALAGRPSRDLWRMLEGRPRLERFVLPSDAARRLAESAGDA